MVHLRHVTPRAAAALERMKTKSGVKTNTKAAIMILEAWEEMHLIIEASEQMKRAMEIQNNIRKNKE